MLGGLLYAVGGIGSLVCWIMVLIKMFKTQPSPVQGIIGIFCPIWAFIWGWMNATKQGLKNIMLMWTVAIILSAIGGSIAGNAAAKAIMEEANKQKMHQVEMTPTE